MPNVLITIPLYCRGQAVAEAVVDFNKTTRDLVLPHKWNLTVLGYPLRSIREEGQSRIEYLHRVIYEAAHGIIPGGFEVDHDDRDKLNSTLKNLRLLRRGPNIANSGPRRNNKSGYKGVSWCRQTGRWRGDIQVNYKRINLGRFDRIDDAARAVNEAYRKHFPGIRLPNPEA